jgi:hypothetical protein
MSQQVVCPDCKQRVGVVGGKIALHQVKGSGTATCKGSGKSA